MLEMILKDRSDLEVRVIGDGWFWEALEMLDSWRERKEMEEAERPFFCCFATTCAVVSQPLLLCFY